MVERSSSALDRTYMALSDPTRRAILERLRRGEARVTDLARPLPMSLSAASKHIAVLEDAGLVRREIRGREHFLTVQPSALTDAAEWIAEYTRFWSERTAALAAHLRRRRG